MTYPADKQSYIQIGWLGEADARRIVLDISELKALCPDATWKLLYKRPEDELPYAAETTVDGNELTWHISSVDVAQTGRGSAQVLGVKSDSRTGVDQVVVKGPVHTVRIEQSLIGETENPVHVWLELAQEAAQRAEGAALDARLSADSAEQNATQAAKSAENANTDAATATSAAQNATHAAETATRAAESADTAAEKAESSATTAQKSADAAAQSATKAQESASAAAQSATQAQESANAAAQSATQAQSSAATAETLAQQAANSVQLAADRAVDAAYSALTAKECAQNAGDSATKAEQSETRAQLSATAAQQYASQAQGSASAAAQSAASAQGDAGNALQSANSASAAASNASASANAAGNSAQQAVSAADTARTDAATAQDAAQDAVEHASAAQKAAEAAENAAHEALGIIDDEVVAQDSTWSSMGVIEKLCPLFEVSGNVVQCEPVECGPLDVTVEIVPTQEGEGDPSPENVRPIVGWNSVNIWRCGKNFCDGSLVEVGGYAGATGGTTNFLNRARIPKMVLPIQVAFKWSVPINYKIINSFAYSSDGTMIRVLGSSPTVTLAKGEYYYAASFARTDEGNMGTDDIAALQVGLMLEISTMPTAYESYQGDTFTVELGQTVYGGTLDADTGTLTVTHAKRVFDGSENWVYGAAFNGFETPNTQAQMMFAENQICTCNVGTGALLNQLERFSIRIAYNVIRFQGFSAQYQDVDSFKRFLQAQNAEIVARIVSPIPIQLSPQQVRALSGTNTLYADAGPVTVKGYSDPVTIINKLSSRIAALEDAQTTI